MTKISSDQNSNDEQIESQTGTPPLTLIDIDQAPPGSAPERDGDIGSDERSEEPDTSPENWPLPELGPDFNTAEKLNRDVYGASKYQYELRRILRDKPAATENLIARYVILSLSLQASNSAQYYGLATTGIRCIQAGRTEVALRIWEELNFRTSTTAALSEVMIGMMSVVKYIAGTVFAVLFLYLLPSFVSTFIPINKDQSYEAFTKILSFARDNISLELAVLFGCLGSVVSILLRLSEFETMAGRSRQYLRYTGMTLPIIGGTFAAVISSLFVSGIINMKLGATTENGTLNPYLFIIIGFLCGFSERFARVLLSNVESKFTGSNSQ
ncbi:hypothetical protein ELH21_09240 [Rhizobium leguminosarum]|uniref:hypothetical protein n=1 Tax=Rhizobium leguminosarum TaxID=384 RepID=UPI00103226E3|nr:hypothetical protein [Rhizobium leguminosarum]TBD04562.1 hypothetical protein ELH21_09240 [Rhizobium leguminosarum]